jgi:peptide/nickel transport system permease protein
MVVIFLGIALFGTYLAPYDPIKMSYGESFQGPTPKHVVGTDQFGRDQLSRIISGTQTSMLVAFGAAAIATTLGILLGLLSGYFGGWLDHVIMRLLDVIFAFPMILLALSGVAAFGPSMINLLFILGGIYGARMARIVRGSVLSTKQRGFIEAARSSGAGHASIMSKFILPNILSPIIVQATFSLAAIIEIEASLSFLGLGTQPPHSSWGQMLSASRSFLETAPWLAVFPGIAIILAVLAFNFLGDALRDAFDPRLSQR